MPLIPGGLADVSLKVDPIPAATYDAVISEFGYLTAGTGAKMFKSVVQIDGGEYDKRVIYENIVIENKDGKRNEPGLRRLKNIIAQIFDEDTANSEDFDTDHLVGKKVKIEVIQKQGKDQDDNPQTENRIKRFAAA